MRSGLYIFLVLLSCIWICNCFVNDKVKQKVTIAVLLPEEYYRIRMFKSCLSSEIRQINSGDWTFLNSFYLDSFTVEIHRNYSAVLQTVCKLLNTNTITAIFINANDYTQIQALNSYLFLKLANHVNMPVMTYVPSAYQTNYPRNNELQLVPTFHHHAEAVLALLARYEWYKYSLIVVESPGSDEFIQALDTLHLSKDNKNNFETLSLIKLKETLNKDEILRRFRTINYETRVILLHCEYAKSNVIFEIANRLGLTTHEYIWIFTRGLIESSKSTHVPIGSLALSYNTSSASICKNVISDSIKLWAIAFEKYYRSSKLENRDRILPQTKCWSDSQTGFNNTKYLYGKSLHRFLLESSVKKTHNSTTRFKSNGVLDSVEFQILNLNDKYEWNPVGAWQDKQIVMDDIVWPGKAHKPPLGRPSRFHIKIVTLEEPPFVQYKSLPPEGVCTENSVIIRTSESSNASENSTFYKCATGFYIDILIMLREKLDFTFDMYEVEDKKWGGKVNDSWNGIIHDIISGKADIAMTSLKITEERSEVIDFTVPFMETGIAIIVAKRPGAISTTAFLKPYDYLIWIMILLVILHSVAISVYLFEWLKIKLTKNDQNDRKKLYKMKFLKYYELDKRLKENRFVVQSRIDNNLETSNEFDLVQLAGKAPFSFGRSVWMVWVLLFRATTVFTQPKSFTSKFMSNVWATFCMAFMASYTANLAAFMITKEEYHELKGIEDDRLMNPLSYQPMLKFGTVKHGSTEEVIKKNYPSMHRYMEKFMRNNVSQGIKALKENEIDAFIYDAVVLDYRSGHDENCKLTVVGNWYSMTGYGIALAKGSKYKDMLDRKIMEYSYSGELERSQKFWFSGVCKNKIDTSSSGSHPLGVLNFTSAFMLLGVGICISLILLLVCHCYQQAFKTRLNKYWHRDKCRKEMILRDTKKNACELINCKGSERNKRLLKNNHNSKIFRSISLENCDRKYLERVCSNCDNIACQTQIVKLKEELADIKHLLKSYKLKKNLKSEHYNCTDDNYDVNVNAFIKNDVNHKKVTNNRRISRNGATFFNRIDNQLNIDELNRLITSHDSDLYLNRRSNHSKSNGNRIEYETIL